MEKKADFTQADRDALNTMRVQINKEGNGVTAYSLTDDLVLTDDKLTEAQRMALKKLTLEYFPVKK